MRRTQYKYVGSLHNTAAKGRGCGKLLRHAIVPCSSRGRVCSSMGRYMLLSPVLIHAWQSNPDFSLHNCAVSCGICKVKCKDEVADCPQWAAQGACVDNKHYMAKVIATFRIPCPRRSACSQRSSCGQAASTCALLDRSAHATGLPTFVRRLPRAPWAGAPQHVPESGGGRSVQTMGSGRRMPIERRC